MDTLAKRQVMDKLVRLFIENRHSMYASHGYSDQVLQVNSDNASSRRKGRAGIDMMEDVVCRAGFKRADSYEDMKTERCVYILPDKGDSDWFDYYLVSNEIKFEFRKNRQNKNPDMLIKNKDQIFIIEHKLTNGGGGAQNMEINEIISFTGYEENNPNVHFVSCLQGNYFKRLNSYNDEPKTKKQHDDIMLNLRNFPGNYFVNGKGFERLVADVIGCNSNNEL